MKHQAHVHFSTPMNLPRSIALPAMMTRRL
jgi:hypothetical protein